MSSTLQSKLHKFVGELKVSLSPQEKAKLADRFYEMSVDWLHAAPKKRAKVLQDAKSRIIREFAPSDSRRFTWALSSRQAPSHRYTPLSKSQIVSHLAAKIDVPRKVSQTFFDELFKLAVRECKGGAGKFVIPNIGRAVKAHRKARMGRNPVTGEAIKIKAKTVVRLRAAKAFKDAVLK